jgi:sugar phosphate isomerase/epimerase
LAGLELEALGALAPGQVSQTGRRQLRHLFKSHGLRVTALACPMRHGLDTPLNLQARIDYLSAALTMSYELGAGVVIVTAGRVPAAEETARADLLCESLQALGRHGDRIGATLALQTGLETGDALAQFLGRFDCGSLGVNFDPAGLLMGGFDPYAAARSLRDRIVHAHARDARVAGGPRAFQEVPLGHGDIDWLALVGLFTEISYRGWLVIDRQDPQPGEITASGGFLRRLLPE